MKAHMEMGRQGHLRYAHGKPLVCARITQMDSSNIVTFVVNNLGYERSTSKENSNKQRE